MTIKASTVYGSSSGGVRPNGLQGFTFNNSGASGLGYGVASTINISTGLNTMLSLSGRFSVDDVIISGIDIAAASLRVVIEIDGVTVVDSTQAGSTLATLRLIPQNSNVLCQSSLVIRANKPGSTTTSISYRAISLL